MHILLACNCWALLYWTVQQEAILQVLILIVIPLMCHSQGNAPLPVELLWVT